MGIITTLIAPAWNALTAGQRTAWNTFAAANPFINALGGITSTDGYNMFNSVNTWLITTDEDDSLSDPPADLVVPPRIDYHATSTRIKSLLQDGTTVRKGRLFLEVPDPVPGNTLVWIRNTQRFLMPGFRQYKQPHKLTYLRPGESGTVDLTAFRGIPIPSVKSGQKQKIVGVKGRMRPNQSAGQVIAVNMLNGRFTIGTLLHDH